MAYSPEMLMDFDSEYAILPSLIRSKKTLEFVKMLISDKGGVIPYTYAHKIYHCPKCSEFYEHFFYQVNYDGGIFKPQYKCTKCKTVLEIISRENESQGDLNLKSYPCPKCGKYSLAEDLSSVVMWD
ncbi:MAG: hypothetical protein FH758_08085 [Firmicutes bacterium]|nr:hypothetical protein [Bacillota bacterium]